MMDLELVLQSKEGRKQWLKHLQWTFAEPFFVHFFIKPLMPGFQQKLVIPKKFVIDFSKHVSDVMVLKGPNGESWKVSAAEAGGETVLGHGWADFVKAYSLEMYYVLVFRYDELEARFDVLVFDRSRCEKEIDGSPTLNPNIPRVYLFYMDLIKGQERLSFPRKFVRIFGELLPEKVLLRGPNNTVWNIGISKTETSMFLERGWGEFIKYYALDGSDLLLFRYDEWDKCFYVIVFEATACEKNGCETAQANTNPGSPDESVKEKAKEVKPEPEVVTTPLKNREEEEDDEDDDKEEQEEEGEEKDYDDEEEEKEEEDTAKPRSQKKSSYSLYFYSHRRTVTSTEKLRALHSAKAVRSTKTNFIVVMKPCHVHKRFYVTVPTKVVCNDLSKQPGFALLRAPPSTKTWIVSILYKERGRKGGISGGWYRFVRDNNLEEGDVCVFELLSVREENPNSEHVADMNVSIHRVVEEVVPLTVKKA